MDPVTLSAIIGGAQVGSGVFGALMQSGQNRKSREWSEDMYKLQYNDAIKFWNMQNTYNSPENQIKRMRDAGLNPRLMYGSGSTGGGTAGSIQAPAPNRPEFNAPSLVDASAGVVNMLNSIYDLRMKKEQIDIMRTENDLKVKQAMLIDAQVIGAGVSNQIANKQLSYMDENRIRDLQYKDLVNKKLGDEITYMVSQEERNKMSFNTSMEKAVEELIGIRISNARSEWEKKILVQTLKNLKQDYKLKKLDETLQEVGMTSRDSEWIRILALLTQQTSKNSIKNWFKDKFKFKSKKSGVSW